MNKLMTKNLTISKLITFLILFLSMNIFAQQNNLKIKGNIVNPQKQKIEDAEIFLYDKKNQIVKTTIVQNGFFEFSNLLPQQYYLQVVTEYTTQKEPLFELSEDKNLKIILNEKVSNIDEVKITAKMKIIQIQNGNIKIDIANSQLNKVPTSIDLLSKLPFIYVDVNGERLSMIGKGTPLLYIDNQKVDFSTLTSLSVDDIKSVEIIRNPSAKYEAEGKAVIKVILKNSKKEGYKITFNETSVFNKRFSNHFSVNYQQKKNKTEWKLNTAYNEIQHWESNGFDYSVPSKKIKSDYVIKSITNRPQLIFGANLYQEINEGDYLTFAVNANLRPDKGDNNTTTNYEENGLKKQILTLNHQQRNRATVNSIFNYNK